MDSTDIQRDGAIAALQLARDIINGKPERELAAALRLDPGAAVHAVAYLAGRYVAMLRTYAHVLMVAALDAEQAELLGQMDAANLPEIEGPLREAMLTMLDSSHAEYMLSFLGEQQEAPGE